MASYHLRLKRDRKPDGSRVDAIAHAEYVNREGKYQDYDARKDIMEHLSGNFIFTDRKKAGFGGNEFIPLYHTDSYGSIAATENGIELTRKPSIDTMSIALMIADRTMQHAPLRLAGSKKFQEQAVNAAVINELNISFADERLQKILEERKMIADEERRRFIESGGRYTKRRGLRPYDGNAGIGGEYTGSQETFPGVPGIPSLYPNTESLLVNIEVKQGAIPVLAEGGFSMPTLPERHVADVGEESPVLLPGDAMLHLDEICKRVYQSVRWDVASARRGLAERTANHIVDEIMSRKGELAAQRHLEYINRDAAYEKKGGCLMTGAQLPNWAKGSAKTFFAAADKFEDPGNRRYLEIELSLPNELSLQENKKILDEFLANHLSNHYYAWAIHDKEGLISGQRHPHVHIMFSERIIDDIEKKKGRGKSYYFRKAARRKKDGALAPEAHRRLHGAPKDAKWHSVAILAEIREDFARIQNAALKRNGFSVTVDHRSLKAQRQEALAQGDAYLANLLARVPEEYIGIISPLDAKSTAVKRVLANRALISEQRDILYAAEKLKTEISDLKLKDRISDTLINADDFMKSAALDEARDTIDIIDEYEKDIEKSIQDVNFWKNLLITAEEAELQAKEEYMTEEEKKYMQGYHDLKGHVEHWTEFIANLNEPEKKTDAWEKYNEIKIAVTHRLMDYQRELKKIETTVHKINERLSQEPYSKNIKDAARNILKENASVHKELEKANTVLAHQIESLRQIVHNEKIQEEQRTTFKLSEIYASLRRQFFGYQKELKKRKEEESALRKKVISVERAHVMAVDKYLGGAGKRLREAMRKLEKQEHYWERDWEKYQQLLKATESEQPHIKASLQESYIKLMERRKYLDSERNRLREEKEQNERIISTPSDQEKIAYIAAGIIRKNQGNVERHKKSVEKCENLKKKIEQTRLRIKAVKERTAKEKPNTVYKVDFVLAARIMKVNANTLNLMDSRGEDRSIIETISDAMAGDRKSLPLIFRSTDEALEQNWMLMSEWDRIEKANKDMARSI